MIQNGGVYYVHADHLNTPKVVTDQQQQIVWKGDYKPFGEVEKTISTVDMNLRFPGQYEDRETGLNYNYFRSYDSATGRYAQSDPIGLMGGLNRYIYGLGSPILGIDPKGLRVKWTGSIRSFGATAAFGGQLSFFELTSECKCNKILKIKGFAAIVNYGGGLKLGGKLGGSGSQVELFAKFSDCPNRTDANGSAWMSGFNAVAGVGGSVFSTVSLGSLSTDPSFTDGPAYGFDISITSTFYGHSAVTSSEVISSSCCGGEK